jgi:transmembrane sensor
MSTTDNEDSRDEAALFVIRMGESPHTLSAAERDHLDSFPEWVSQGRNGQEFQALNTITAMVADLPAADLARLVAENPPRPDERVHSRRQVIRNWAMAASVVAVLVLGGFYAQTQHWFGGDSYTTGTGQTRTVTFEDGSLVHLNTRTQVRWLGNARDRRLELAEGEALFDVVHEAARPFRVLLDNSEIRVLGTRFNVYRKPNGDTTVTVLEGTVEVRGFGDGSARGEWVRTLNRNEEITYRTLGLMSEPHATDAQNAIRWRDGVYKFTEQPIEKVLDELTRYTDHRIVIRDPRIAEHRIGGALYTRDVRNALQHLEDLAPIEVKENNNTFTLDYRAKTERGKD